MLNPTQKLHEIGQSLWLDNITRGLLTSGDPEPTPVPDDCASEVLRYNCSG